MLSKRVSSSSGHKKIQSNKQDKQRPFIVYSFWNWIQIASITSAELILWQFFYIEMDVLTPMPNNKIDFVRDLYDMIYI